LAGIRPPVMTRSPDPAQGKGNSPRMTFFGCRIDCWRTADEPDFHRHAAGVAAPPRSIAAMSATTSKPAASPATPPWPGTRADGVAKLEIGGKTVDLPVSARLLRQQASQRAS